MQSQKQSQKPQEVKAVKSNALQKFVVSLSQQKLLPQLLYKLEAECKAGESRHIFHQYQAVVKKFYTEQGKMPLKYNPEDAFTDREKLRKKIQLLQKNELDIDYFGRKKGNDGRAIPTFKGYPLEKVTYDTKKQFGMFKNFNEDRFRQSFNSMFDDKLQLRQEALVQKRRMNKLRAITQVQQKQPDYSMPKPIFNSLKNSQSEYGSVIKNKKKKNKIKLQPLTQPTEILEKVEKSILKTEKEKFKPHIQKVYIGKMLGDISDDMILQKMKKMGSFPEKVDFESIALTKQSISKYLKALYQRQVRLIDFFQLKPKTNFTEYKSLHTKLKLMPTDHILFMCFLFFDFNNDGFICENDLRRIKELYKRQKNSLLQEDYKILNSYKPLKETENSENRYLELYKLPEVSENTYFNWKKKQKEIENNQIEEKRQFEEQLRIEEELERQEEKESQNDQIESQKIVRKIKKQLNPFNPSVLKFKQNYEQEKAEVRKYLLSIKAKKIYISFNEFKSIFAGCEKHRDQNREGSYIGLNLNSAFSKQVVSLDKRHINRQKQKSSRYQDSTLNQSKCSKSLKEDVSFPSTNDYRSSNEAIKGSLNLQKQLGAFQQKDEKVRFFQNDSTSNNQKHYHYKSVAAGGSEKHYLPYLIKHNPKTEALKRGSGKNYQTQERKVTSVVTQGSAHQASSSHGITKPYLWYDLMDKLFGVKFEGLQYQAM